MGKKRKKRYRGHYCWCCGSILSNERFSGRGHRNHICKDCQKMPEQERQKIRDMQFADAILDQKNISKGNIETLTEIAERYPGTELGRIGAVLALVGRIAPGRKKRMGKLYHEHRELFDELVELGLIWDTITPRIEEERMFEEAREELAAEHEEEALESWFW